MSSRFSIRAEAASFRYLQENKNVFREGAVKLLVVYEIATLTGLGSNGNQDIAYNFIYQ